MSVRPAVWLAAVLVVAADLFTKQWAIESLTPGVTQPILGGALSLQLVFNSGAAFSLGEGYTWVLTLVAAAVTVGIMFYAGRARTWWSVALFGIALGGAAGNLIDRLFREPGFGRGHVVDMIKYGDWFVGNVADIAIVASAAAFMASSILGFRPLKPADAMARAASPTVEPSEDAAS